MAAAIAKRFDWPSTGHQNDKSSVSFKTLETGHNNGLDNIDNTCVCPRNSCRNAILPLKALALTETGATLIKVVTLIVSKSVILANFSSQSLNTVLRLALSFYTADSANIWLLLLILPWVWPACTVFTNCANRSNALHQNHQHVFKTCTQKDPQKMGKRRNNI